MRLALPEIKAHLADQPPRPVPERVSLHLQAAQLLLAQAVAPGGADGRSAAQAARRQALTHLWEGWRLDPAQPELLWLVPR